MQFGFESTIYLYPFMLHSLSLSLFSSVIGPFGGFFASGFKRAFKIKVIFLSNFINSTYQWISGFWRYNPRTWRYNGPVRLSIPDGDIRQRVHQQFYPNRQSAKIVIPGTLHETGTTVAALPFAERIPREPKYFDSEQLNYLTQCPQFYLYILKRHFF